MKWLKQLAIPLSVIPTFIVMKAQGYTLNSMTLLGQALVVGVLVDDAIVEIENIARHIRMGKSPRRAAQDASEEIGLAVVATTMTIVAVFFPIAFMTGIPGSFLRPFALTVSVSVLFSLLVARTITPLMAAYWMKMPHKAQNLNLVRRYHQILAWSLKHRLLVMLGAGIFFISSLHLLPLIPTSFIAPVDIGEVTLSLELPHGATLAETDRALQQATQIIRQRPEVAQVFSTVGDSDVNSATIYIGLIPKEQRISQSEFEQVIRGPLSEVPGVRLSVTGTDASGTGKLLNVTLVSDDAETLEATARTLTQQMRTISGLVDVSSSASLLNPELMIRPNFNRAAEQGVAIASIARTAKIATLGDIESNQAKFNLSDRQIPIRVQLDPSVQGDLQALGNIQVATRDGRIIPLRAVADLAVGSSVSQIARLNRSRTVEIGANLVNLTLGEAIKRVHNLPVLKNLPANVHELSEGDTKVQSQVFGQFVLVLAAAVMLIYAVLVLLFNDFVYPLIIMVALPLSLGGAFIGLLVFGKDLGLYAVIGILMLMGLVTKNSILVVEYSLLAMRGKVMEVGARTQISRSAAIITAGMTRLQPILMTTVAMVQECYQLL